MDGVLSRPSIQSPVFLIQLADSDVRFECAGDDTVLRAALRQGLAFPYECNVGSCGNCKFEVRDGTIESNWPQAPGLSEKDKIKNRQLGCQCKPTSNLTIKFRAHDKYRPVHQPLKLRGTIIGQHPLTHDLSEFHIQLAQPMTFSSGQYAVFQLPGVAGVRAYSMSNSGGTSTDLEIQVRRTPEGIGSKTLFELTTGSDIELDGPYGMAYLREDSSRDILCLAGGSGLAPMLSVARGAMRSASLQNTRVHFLYGGRTAADICGRALLEQTENWRTRGSYQAVVSANGAEQALPEGYLAGFLHEAAERLFGDALSTMEIYFAGPAVMAQAILKLLVERKVNMDHVHFDQFY